MQIETEKGLKTMFLKSNKYFTWNDAREDSIHRFFAIYDINSHLKFVQDNLSQFEIDRHYSHWASAKQVENILAGLKLKS